MKTFFKKNLIWMFALVVGIGSMSFKVVEKNLTSTFWYEVQSDGTSIGGQTNPSACEGSGTPCAVEFNRDHSIPATLSEAQSDPGYLGMVEKN